MLGICLCGGIVVQYVTAIRMPGAVCGLIILLLWLIVLRRVPVGLKRVSDLLLRHMALFFIPLLVALLEFEALILDSGIVILLALIPSTILALMVTGWIFVRLAPPWRTSSDKLRSSDG